MNELLERLAALPVDCQRSIVHRLAGYVSASPDTMECDYLSRLVGEAEGQQ